MHAWRAYAAVVLPLVCLLWGQIRFADARESLHVDLRHELSRLEQSLERDTRPPRRRIAIVKAAARMQARSERFADAAFHTLLYFGFFPLVLGLSLLAADHLQRDRATRR